MPIKLVTKNNKEIPFTPTPFEVIQRMKEEYERLIWTFSSDALQRRFPGKPGIKDAKSAWVSRKELEALLNDNNADGMRIYYGCHFESTGDFNPHLDYHGLHNLILVATKDKRDPENPKYEHSEDQLRVSENPQEANSVIFSGEYDGMGDDMLPLCPPRCPQP